MSQPSSFVTLQKNPVTIELKQTYNVLFAIVNPPKVDPNSANKNEHMMVEFKFYNKRTKKDLFNDRFVLPFELIPKTIMFWKKSGWIVQLETTATDFDGIPVKTVTDNLEEIKLSYPKIIDTLESVINQFAADTNNEMILNSDNTNATQKWKTESIGSSPSSTVDSVDGSKTVPFETDPSKTTDSNNSDVGPSGQPGQPEVLPTGDSKPAISSESTTTGVQSGGGKKVFLLGRFRNIYLQGRKQYIRYENRYITLQVARQLQKQLDKREKAKANAKKKQK